MAALQWLPEKKGALHRNLLWFVVPALTMYSCFVILPAVSSVYLGFTSYDGVTEASMRFIGWDNYKNIFESARFHSATFNTILIAAAFTVLVNVIALAMAVAVDKVRWCKNIFRSTFYLPVLISGIIAGFIWRIMFNYSFGVINFALNAIGLGSVKFIDTMPNALLSIIFVLLWKNAGYYMIIYLAALQGISTDLLEAASIDGANGRQTFRHVTLPMLAGSFTINLTLALINGLKVYDEIAILTNGGPGFSTETITYMVYKVAFGEMRQGYGTAMAVILFIIILVMGGFQSTMLRKREVQL
ncbi:MAG: sugar ABC transporter permease [Clostridia bacterium]|nr:sugar ABC transporter permease [Clostridia bacterium]